MSIKQPRLVAVLCQRFGAWVVGSAADPSKCTPRDWDVCVPLGRWGEAATLIPSNAEVNSFGGWKVKDGNYEIDIWPGDLRDVMLHHRTTWVWDPCTGSRFRRA
jgi:hypothetical protein